MKHKVLFLAVMMMAAFGASAQGYDFFSVSPSGDTLYYQLNGDAATVVYPVNTDWDGHTKPSGHLIIPDSVSYMGISFPVTAIGSSAFYQCDSITTVSFPDGITTIGANAFEYCVGLTSITLPPVVSISNWTFAFCSNLASVVIPEGVISIDYDAFYCCTSLTSANIPSSVTYIGSSAFERCSSLTSITIPDSVTSIGSSAFERCSSLTSVTIGGSVISIGNQAFKKCINLTSVTIGSSVTTIGSTAFSECPIESITIPASVNHIDYSFSQCHSLKSVTILSTNINSTAFYGCDSIEYLHYNGNNDIPNYITKANLQTLVVGNTITSIPASAFQNLTHLSHVTIGNSVDSIGDNAFRFCTALDTIIALPATAPALGSNVFQGTPSTKTVIIGCDADYAPVWGSTGFNYTTGGFSLTLASNNESWGTAGFVQAVNCQQTAIIEATATPGHRFVQWSDGSTANPRTITLVGNTTLTADFMEYNVTVTTAVNNELMGSVTGAGTYLVDQNITLTAVANCNYRFVRWQDNDTVNPRTVSLSSDTVFTAYFELNSDTVFVHDTTYVDVHDTTYIDVHDTTYVDVHDTTYIDVHDTTIVYDTVTLTEYVHDTTIVHDTVTLTEYVHDTTIVTNTIYDTVTLTEYVHDTLWLHDTVVVHDTVYVGISGAEATNAKIYQQGGQLVVAGAEHQTVILYDAVGRALDIKNDEGNELRFDIPATGVYLIKIGAAPARRVMVIR